MFRGLSLFANVGIAELFLKDIGIDVVLANELLEDRAKFYKHTHANTDVIIGDITKDEIYNEIIEKAKKMNINYMLITPPCQGMSFAGKRNLSDSRNMLFKYGIDCIVDLQPEYAIIENVPTFFNIPIIYNNETITIIEYIKIKLHPYNITYDIIDCADYGIPQHRKRAIVLISKHTIPKFSNKESKKITVRQAIEKLPTLESGEKSNIKYHNAKKHNSRHIEFMKHTPTGKTALYNKVHYPKKEDGTRIKGYSTTYKRIEWDKPSPTITMANGSVSSQNNVHPGRLLENGTYSDARVLSLKEIMILSSIPDTWDVPQWASENLIRKVIGEGIPPLLIKKLSKKLTEQYVK